MKKLKIYKENGEFVIERVNEFDHATKRFFVTEDGLFDGLLAYKDIMGLYELEVSDDLWAKVVNFLSSEDMQPNAASNEEVLVLHKKMYDVRWNGAEGDPEGLEKEFVSLAESAGITLEKINSMLHEIYIPPYQEDKLPAHLKANTHGGKREGAGRPSVGTTKKVSITLPDEIWEMIEQRKEELGASQSATLRMMIEGYWNSENEEEE